MNLVISCDAHGSIQRVIEIVERELKPSRSSLPEGERDTTKDIVAGDTRARDSCKVVVWRGVA